MYLDIYDFGTYNRRFAQLAGLQAAVYWNELMCICKQVVKKSTFDEFGFFTLDRNYVYSQTSLTVEQQIESDKILIKLGLVDLDPDNPNRLRTRQREFNAIVTEERDAEIKQIIKTAKSATKAGKSEGKRIGTINRLISQLHETDSAVLTAYRNWLEVVYDKNVNKNSQIQIAEETLNNFTDNAESKIAVLKIATTNAYRELHWAVDIYQKQGGSAKFCQQKIVSEISEIRL